MSHNGQKTTAFMMLLPTFHNPNQKTFFHCRLEDLPKLFEGLNSSLVQSAEKLWRW